MLVDALRNEYRVADLLDRLGLARSSYFYHRSPMRIADKYAEVRRIITEIFEDNHRSYGYRRIRATLSRQRVFLSEKVVQRLMKQERLQAADVSLVCWGSESCAREHHCSRLPRRRP